MLYDGVIFGGENCKWNLSEKEKEVKKSERKRTKSKFPRCKGAIAMLVEMKFSVLQNRFRLLFFSFFHHLLSLSLVWSSSCIEYKMIAVLLHLLCCRSSTAVICHVKFVFSSTFGKMIFVPRVTAPRENSIITICSMVSPGRSPPSIAVLPFEFKRNTIIILITSQRRQVSYNFVRFHLISFMWSPPPVPTVKFYSTGIRQE